MDDVHLKKNDGNVVEHAVCYLIVLVLSQANKHNIARRDPHLFACAEIGRVSPHAVDARRMGRDHPIDFHAARYASCP